MVSVIYNERQSRLIEFMNNLVKTHPISKTHSQTYSQYGWHITRDDVDELHCLTIYGDYMHHNIDTMESNEDKIYLYQEHTVEDIETALLASISNIEVYVFRSYEDLEPVSDI